MSDVVRLHVGAPKTGTTYIQDRLVKNAAGLARHGVHFPAGSRLVDADLFQFRAALDLLGQDWGGVPGHAKGAWPQLVKAVRRARGTAIISHEILATASDAQVVRAMNDLAGAEVHLVYSARDLGRAVPAAWQENLKQGAATRYRTFLRRFAKGSGWAARVLDLPAVLERWGAHLPPEQIHVVVVPQRDRDPHGDELWHRFCTALGIDPAWAPLDSQRANSSIRIAEAQVLRRLNRLLERRPGVEGPADVMLLEMVRRGEFGAGSSARITLPPQRHDWAAEGAQRWISWIEESGVQVVGDLDDLRPRPPIEGERWIDPDRVRSKLVARAAVKALAAMTLEAARRPDPDLALSQRVRRGVRRLRE